MRRVLLLLLSIFLASGTVAGAIAHAGENCGQATPIAAGELRDWDGCVVTTAKADKDAPSDDGQLPSPLHGCHGHHSGVPADVAAPPAEAVHLVTYVRVPSAPLPPAAFTGTFRPPIA